MSAIVIAVVDIFFASWASKGSVWYFYLLNFVLLFLASSILNTAFIRGITTGYAYICLYGLRGIIKALGLNIFTLLFFALSYFVSSFVFSINYQMFMFFLVCLLVSFFVAISDGLFGKAVSKERMLKDIIKQKNNKKESKIYSSQENEIRISHKKEYNILLVDDEPSIHMLIPEEINEFFANKNIRTNVSSFLNPKEAAATLSTINPDIIISCICMPEMNGIDFLKICKQELPGIPFIFYSACRELTFDDGDAFIQKSADTTELLNEIEKQLIWKKIA